MNRWNIVQVAFYGVGKRRRTLNLRPDNVTILTGRSGTGKSAILDTIRLLPWFQNLRASLLRPQTVHWSSRSLE